MIGRPRLDDHPDPAVMKQREYQREYNKRRYQTDLEYRKKHLEYVQKYAIKWYRKEA